MDIAAAPFYSHHVIQLLTWTVDSSMQPLDIAVLRGQFPALNQLVDGKTPIFFDGPGGAQVPHSVLTAMTDYLGRFNANLGGNADQLRIH